MGAGKQLKEVDPREVFGKDDEPDEAQSLAGELESIEARITELEAELVNNGPVGVIANASRQLEARKAELLQKLQEAKQRGPFRPRKHGPKPGP